MRRRIKSGKPEAEKVPGPYGEQYMLPAEQFGDIAQEITDVVPVERSLPVEKFQALVREAVKDEVQKAVAEALKKQEEEVKQLRKELEARDRELLKAIREKQQEPPGLWERLKSWLR